MSYQRSIFYLVAVTIVLWVKSTTDASIILDWVNVGDPGNPENTVIKKDGTSGYGAVDYSFRISKYETTNYQYAEFLNAVAPTDTYNLYHPSMGSALEGGIIRTGTNGSYSYSIKANMDNKPVNFVSWYDSARFANWFQNGQPTGMQDSTTTEDGAYTFSGPETVTARNTNAKFYIPDEHEWQKAAFYEPGADTYLGNGWWLYPSHSDVFPTPATVDEFGNVNNPDLHTVVFRNAANWNGSTRGNVATVGSAGNESYYGARDMSGNLFEWVTADPTKPDPNGWGPYTVYGGSYIQFGHVDLFERNLVHHDNHAVVDPTVGFRLAAIFVEADSADFNNDTYVNGFDLELWKLSYGSTSEGDADHDGDSDGNDFLTWQRQYVTSISLASSTQVPEPCSYLFSGGLVIALILNRPKRIELYAQTI